MSTTTHLSQRPPRLAPLKAQAGGGGEGGRPAPPPPRHGLHRQASRAVSAAELPPSCLSPRAADGQQGAHTHSHEPLRAPAIHPLTTPCVGAAPAPSRPQPHPRRPHATFLHISLRAAVSQRIPAGVASPCGLAAGGSQETRRRHLCRHMAQRPACTLSGPHEAEYSGRGAGGAAQRNSLAGLPRIAAACSSCCLPPCLPRSVWKPSSSDG